MIRCCYHRSQPECRFGCIGEDAAIAMSNQNTSSFANSDTPIPVVQIHPADGSGPRTPNPEHGSHHRLSASKLKDKLESLGDNMSRESTSRMGDRMINL